MNTRLVLVLLLFWGALGSAQVRWTKYSGNPILSPAQVSAGGQGFDARHAWMPMVMFENGLYRMWYIGYGYDDQGYGPVYRVGAAISENGLDWYRYAKNPVVGTGAAGSFDAGRIWGGCVIKVGSTYRMYYGGYAGKFSIGLFESTDGITWERHSAPKLTPGPSGSWDQDGVSAPSVMRDSSGRYRMWYSGTNGNSVAIGLAFSEDGLTWTKWEGNPILKSDPSIAWESMYITDSRVLRIDSMYHMFYFGLASGTGFGIGYASSADGVHWTKYPGNPVLKPGPRGSWEEYSLSQGWVIFKDNEFKLWYGARQYADIFQIGYASSPLGATSQTTGLLEHPGTPERSTLLTSYPNPFNPSTTIVYSLARRGNVRLTVYDVTGREVTVLADGAQEAGQHEVVWNAGDAASGMYLVRMTLAGEQGREVQKVVLVR